MNKGVQCLILVLALVVTGCQEGKENFPDEGTRGSGGVAVGMTRSDVQAAMLDEVRKLQMVGQVKNPYSTEVRQGAEGQVYEVMFYYKGLEKGDNQVSDDELMPIVLLDGKVVGWGWEFLGEVTSIQ